MADTLKAYLIVFVASACGLTIEIVAARLLAPTVGVSLYTWTSVIGVVLAGFSVGNYLGGRVADRFPSPTTLGLILLAAAFSSLGVLPLVVVVPKALEGVTIVTRIVLLTASLFFVPSMIVGMVTPVVVKLRLRDLARTGKVVGTIYAISAAGSIFGTFITGFCLVQWLGTTQTLLLVALVLALLALAVGKLWRARAPGLAAVALFAALVAFSVYSGALASDCERESNYYCIRVLDATAGDRKVKVLGLDALLHSYSDPDDPRLLVYSYEKVLADIAEQIAQRDPGFRALFIGGGGYTFPGYLEAVYPQSRLEVIEIDPEVTRVAFEYMGLRPDTGIISYNEDARMAVRKLPRDRFDLVVGDAFHDFSIPYHLTTKEFNEEIRALLNDRGIYVVIAVDKLHSGRFLKAYVHTLKQTFANVQIIRDSPRWQNDDRDTHVVVASSVPLSQHVLVHATAQAGESAATGHFMPEEALASWLESSDKVLLTDDYAPVESFMAPIFLAKDDVGKALVRYEAGLALLNKQQLQRAVEEFNVAIELDPKLAPAYFHRGACYHRMGQSQPAIRDFSRALEADPEYVEAFQMRAAAYAALGQPRRGIEDVDAAIRINSGGADAYGQRAVLHAAIGNQGSAWADFEQAVELGANAATLKAQLRQLGVQR